MAFYISQLEFRTLYWLNYQPIANEMEDWKRQTRWFNLDNNAACLGRIKAHLSQIITNYDWQTKRTRKKEQI